MYDRRETSKLTTEKFSEYCKLLEIENSDQPTVGEVNQKFRKLSIKCHPDKAKNDPAALETFQSLVNARDALVVHIQLYGVKNENFADNDLSHSQTNRFFQKDESRKPWSMPATGISLDAILACSYDLISKISGIQRRLLTTLIEIITEEKKLNKFPFRRVFSTIERVQLEIKNALDSKKEHEEAAKVIIQLIKHIKGKRLINPTLLRHFEVR